MRAWKRDAPFVGRKTEIAFLEAALDDVVQDRPRTVLIVGEAGVGKTRLVDEFEANCRSSDMLVAHGACVAVGAGELPYSPWIEVMHAIEAEIGPGELLDSATGEAAMLSALIPVLPEAPAPAQPGQIARAHLFSQFLDVLCRLAAKRPLIILLEDLHWADTSSIDLLLFLTRNTRHHPLMLVATYRTEDMDAEPHHRAAYTELIRSPGTGLLDLQRFDLAGTAALLRATSSTDLPEALVERVHRRSGGNAFLAQELLAAEQLNPGGHLPDHLRDLLMMRVEALSDEGQQVVAVVAAAGRPTSGSLLEQASGLLGPALRKGLRDAVARQVLIRTQPSCYVVRHSLTAEALYQDLLPGERADLHRAVATALAKTPARDDSPAGHAELAHHWFHGQQYDKALATALRAARAAVVVLAYAEARTQYERVLELWHLVSEPAQLCDTPYPLLLLETAETFGSAGMPERAVALIREAVQHVGDAPEVLNLRASLYEHLAWYLWRSNDHRGALDAAQRCVDLLADRPPSALQARAHEIHARILMLGGQYRHARDRCRIALDMATSAGARVEEGCMLVTLGTVNFMLGERDEGVALLRDGLALAEETGDTENILRGYTNLAYCLYQLNRLDEAVEVGLRGCARAKSLGVANTLGIVVRTNTADILFDLGRWDDIDRLLGDLRQGDVSDEMWIYVQNSLADLRRVRGDLAVARTLLDPVLRLSADKSDQDFVGQLYTSLAELEIDSGNWRAARRAVDEGMMRLADGEGLYPALRLCATGLRTAADAAQAMRRRGDHEAVQRWTAWADGLAERARAISAVLDATDDGPPPRMVAFAAQVTAELTRVRDEPGEDAWAGAIGAWTRLGHPYPEAYARLRYAECLLRRGAIAAVRREVDAAHTIARRLGAVTLVGDIETLAAVGGVALQPVSPAPVAAADRPSPTDPRLVALTRRERQVLDLVAQGYTNGRIARSLSISEKTVSIHVSNILGKLGASNRWEAALILRGQPTGGP
jgi:DNA-binding CsgD family transcriptional regulator/tetratricopeptide (TPR) repeat protein